MASDEGRAFLNTDRELYREPKGDLPSDYYANSLHATAQGAIGMNVGGTVYTLPIREWHALAGAKLRPTVSAGDVAEVRQMLARVLIQHHDDGPFAEADAVLAALAPVIEARVAAAVAVAHEMRIRRLNPPEGADLPTWHALHQTVLTIVGGATLGATDTTEGES